MKMFLSFIFLGTLVLAAITGYAAPSHVPVNTEDHVGILQQTIPLDRSQLESRLGRKLKFKERIALSILKSKIKHAEKKGHALNFSGYQPETEGFAIASFVIGIVGILLLNFMLGILAIIFGAISLSRIRKFDGLYKGQGFATAGLVLGIVAVALGALVLVLSLAFFWL